MSSTQPIPFQKTTQSKLTTELYDIPLQPGRHLIYAPLARTAFVANGAMVNLLLDIQDKGAKTKARQDPDISRLLHATALFEDEATESDRCKSQVENTSIKLSLIMSSDCDFTFGFTSKDDSRNADNVMTLEIALSAIDTALSIATAQKTNRVSLTYYGSLNVQKVRDVMSDSLRYVQNVGQTAGIDVTTQLICPGPFSETSCCWLVGRFDCVTFLAKRLPVNSSYLTGEKLLMLDEEWSVLLDRCNKARLQSCLRIRMNPNDANYLTDFVRELCMNYQPIKIELEPNWLTEPWTGERSTSSKKFLQAYRRAVGIARQFKCRITVPGANLDSYCNFCGILPDEFIISPDGCISECVCHALGFSSTPLSAFALMSSTEHRNSALRASTYCNDCFAKWNCAGPCLARVNEEKRPQFQGSERCDIVREITKDWILSQIADAGGLIWRDEVGVNPRRKSTSLK